MADAVSYVVKRVQFFGRGVSVVLQNVNGPCPLLAIANVLSLRNQLKLPRESRSISQEQLVTMVADLLLDASKQYERASATPEAAAHAAHAVSECFDVLSKLATGIDVNVKFHSVHAFEPTREVAVFDLLGISLVHGWLVDPEDVGTAAVFGNRSYNALVELLLSALGGSEVERLSSATSLVMLPRGGGGSGISAAAAAAAAAAAVDAAAAGAPAIEAGGAAEVGQPEQQQQQQQQPQHRQDISALVPSDDVAVASGGLHLRKLCLHEQTAAPAAAAAAAAGTAAAAAAADSAVLEPEEAAVESVLGDLVSSVCQDLQPGRIALGESPTRSNSVDRAAVYGAAPPPQSRLGRAASSQEQPAAAADPELAGPSPPQQQPAAAPTPSPQHREQQPQQQQAACPPSPTTAARDAAVVSGFLERHCTQLTPAGLAALADDLREHQLAVFFRNNHFSTAFKYEGRVYLLVTDQGYASEPDIVWERLDAVDGNTALCTSAFEEFVPHAEPPYDPAAFEAAAAAAAAGAAAAGSAAAAGGVGAGAAGGGGHGMEDADFALALQLQMQEEEAAERERAERQRRAEAQEGPPQPAQRTGAQPTRAGAVAAHQQQQQQQQQQRRPGRGPGHQRPATLDGAAARLRPVMDKVEEKCSIS